MNRLAALAAVAAALALAPAVLADGPTPGAADGGAGVVGTGGAVRYVSILTGRTTLLEAVSTRDGRVLRWQRFAGSIGIPLVAYDGTTGGLSRHGRLLVLEASGFPAGPSTSFHLVDARTFRSRTLTLRGSFTFDALSPEGRRLYLIQYVSARNLSRYVVRAYDLRRRRLLPGAIADRTQRGWVMQGSPLARATSAGGRFVYTLYQNPGGYPFVHALDTVRGVAHCIGLPWTGDQSIFGSMRLALGNGGRTLSLAVPWSDGRPPATLPSFRIDTRSYRVFSPAAA